MINGDLKEIAEDGSISPSNPLHPDTDSDGTNDKDDAFPDDPTENNDRDNDGKGDNSDNCPDDHNPYQENTDVLCDGSLCMPDNLGDACDNDKDGDGLLDNENESGILKEFN